MTLLTTHPSAVFRDLCLAKLPTLIVLVQAPTLLQTLFSLDLPLFICLSPASCICLCSQISAIFGPPLSTIPDPSYLYDKKKELPSMKKVSLTLNLKG